MNQFIKSKYILVLFVVFISCGISLDEKNLETKNSEKELRQDTNNQNIKLKLNKYDNIFVYEDNYIKQILKVKYINENEILFVIDFENKDNKHKCVLEGKAINKNRNLDPEIDENEEGNAYPSNEFEFKRGKCIVKIRIAMMEKNKAVVRFIGCEQFCLIKSSYVLNIKLQ